jgi:enoyl-[acyl-carrier protein] reductase II
MYPDVLRDHIRKMKQATDKPWGVNVPLLYPDIDALIDILEQEGVKIVFTSAGNPAKYTSRLKASGMTVVHVIANTKFALKCEEAGVDAIVAEGFEAGGHNGREETTSLVLIPKIRKVTSLPLIAAGGIASGESMAAAMMLGADGVQIGSLFASATESSAHDEFKRRILATGEGDTMLSLKKLAPVRLIKNEFFNLVNQAEQSGASAEELKALLGRGRAKKGIFEGDMVEGELEIGQCAALIDKIDSVENIMKSLVDGYHKALNDAASNPKYQF